MLSAYCQRQQANQATSKVINLKQSKDELFYIPLKLLAPDDEHEIKISFSFKLYEDNVPHPLIEAIYPTTAFFKNKDILRLYFDNTEGHSWLTVNGKHIG